MPFFQPTVAFALKEVVEIMRLVVERARTGIDIRAPADFLHIRQFGRVRRKGRYRTYPDKQE
jgi:hypothetical protein